MMNEGIKPKIEKAKDPEDIYTFFRDTFGEKMFFIESLLALKGEERDKLYKLLGLNPEDEVNKKKMSYKMVDVAKRGGGKIKKFPFNFTPPGKVTMNLAAFHTLPSTITLDKNLAIRVFKEDFPDIAAGGTPKIKEAKPNTEITLTAEEQRLFEKAKRSAGMDEKYVSELPLSHKIAFVLIRKLEKLGLLQVIRGNTVDSMIVRFVDVDKKTE
jgi:hypothetical protein